MGEAEFEQKGLVATVGGALAQQAEAAAELRVTTPGGRFQVRWDEEGSATALGQLAFFAEFLEVSGLFERWVASCPMAYTSPNAPAVRDVLGTWLLSILDGQRRYAHVTGLRGDAVAPQILGMTKIVRDESLRRGLAHLAPTLKRCPEAQRAGREAQLARSAQWMDEALAQSTRQALSTGWILDADTTVKPLYGHQDGAQISYNPTKPGRPSHVIHTYWIANLRLVLDAEVQNGKAHAARHSLPRLVSLLKELAPEQRPRLVRADNAFGNEPVMAALEEIGQTYLSKLRQSPGVKVLIERLWSSSDDWENVGGGYYAVETRLKLSGWSRARRVVVVRRALKAPLAAEEPATGKRAKRQQSLQFAQALPVKLWEYAVLVTNADYDLEAIGQLYRDRADCENGFDELKNQWGWGGYTTQDLERCNLSARAVALIYNWWSWYVRLAHPKTRLEAITSRPMLLAAVGQMTRHSRATKLVLAVTHEAAKQIKVLIANVRAGLSHILSTAPQLDKAQRWPAMLRYIVAQMLACQGPRGSPPAIVPAG